MVDDDTLRAYQRDRDAAIARADRAEAWLAALRSACTDCGNNPCILAERPLRGVRTQGGCRCRDNIRAALAALPADIAAERDRRVRAEALESAADRIDAGKCRECAALLRARAADERGGR